MGLLQLFSTNGFMPHGHCYLWKPQLVWIMVISDLSIGLSYTIISYVLYRLVKQIKLPFQVMFLAFGLFIFACGLTHFLEIYTLWIPNYWLSAAIKVVTAAASVTTAFYLLKTKPLVLEMASTIRQVEEKEQAIKALYKEKAINQEGFRNILEKNIRLPLFLMSLASIFFSLIILYMFAMSKATDQSNQIISKANEVLRLMVDAESGMRGYFVAKNVVILETYNLSLGALPEEFEEFETLTAENVVQLARVKDVKEQFRSWEVRSKKLIEASKQGKSIYDFVKMGSGKILMDKMRAVVSKIILTEEHERDEKIAEVRRTAIILMMITVVVSLLIGVLLSFHGRKQLFLLSANYTKALEHRDEFLSIASHELRTPLSALYLQVQIAQRTLNSPNINTEELKERMKIAAQQAKNLGVLIDTLMDISRIAYEKITIVKERINITQIIQENVEKLKDASRFDGHVIPQITLNLENDIYINCDKVRINQVITNILSNAIKYGEGKPIAVYLKTEGEKVVIDVQDQGPGISHEDQSRIFDRFERGQSSAKISGFGLGLYITKQIAEAHGGTLSVKSEVGKGSIFTLVLPV